MGKQIGIRLVDKFTEHTGGCMGKPMQMGERTTSVDKGVMSTLGEIRSGPRGGEEIRSGRFVRHSQINERMVKSDLEIVDC